MSQHVKRGFVYVVVRSQDGPVLRFSHAITREMKSVMGTYARVYAERNGITKSACRFTFDGARVDAKQTPQDLKLQDGDIIHCTLAHEEQEPVASASDASAASVPAVVAANMAASTQSATAAATTVTLGGTDGDSDGDDLSEGAMDMDDSTQGPDATGDAQQPHWFVAGGFRGLPRKSQLEKLHAHLRSHVGQYPSRSLANWVHCQRQSRRGSNKSTMTDARAAQLEELPGWTWEGSLRAPPPSSLVS